MDNIEALEQAYTAYSEAYDTYQSLMLLYTELSTTGNPNSVSQTSERNKLEPCLDTAMKIYVESLKRYQTLKQLK